MWEFSKVLAQGLEKGDVLLVIAATLVLVVMNVHKLSSLLLERKRHRLKSVEAALQSEHVQGLERECLKEWAATEHFYAATGIMMETAPRQRLLRIYERSGGRVQFVHFKRAASYFHYEDGSFEVRLGRFERWLMQLGLSVGIPLFAFSLALLFMTLFWVFLLGSEAWVPWSTWLLFSVVGWAMVISSRSAYSARCILKEMKRQSEMGKPDEGVEVTGS